MAKNIGQQTNFSGGISSSKKEGIKNSFRFNRCMNFRSEPTQLTLNPSALLDSGTVVQGLPMCGERTCDRLYFYDDNGNITLKDGDTYEIAHTAADSTGNGMKFFGEDNSLYYAQNTTLGRLQNPCTDDNFTDDFLSAEGGNPTNKYSLDLESSISQYAYRNDTSSLSMTGALSLEAYCKLESLPASNNPRTIMSKWDEQANKRSYKMDINTSTDFFGDGRDGALSISTAIIDTPADANCSGSINAYTLTVSNTSAGFTISQGDAVLIYQARGTGTGLYQISTVKSYSGSTVILNDKLKFTVRHSSGATNANKGYLMKLKQYTNVTIVNTGVYTAKLWDGFKGGILGFLANGTVTVNGILNSTERGYRRGLGGTINSNSSPPRDGQQGEGYSGNQSRTYVANGNGGGGGVGDENDGYADGAGGGGGGYSQAGKNGSISREKPQYVRGGNGGITVGDSNLTSIFMGGGGGGGGNNLVDGGSYYAQGKNGAYGGGIILVYGKIIQINGYITANGGIGTDPEGFAGGGGCGAGGTVNFKGQTVTLNNNRVRALGGTTATSNRVAYGGNGSYGRIKVNYSSNVTGSTTPAFTKSKDSSLGASSGYVLRLSISDDGSTEETFSWDITNKVDISNWRRYQISWKGSTSTATAYIGGVSLGAKTGSFTSIHDNSSRFAIGTVFNSSGNSHYYYDGLIDEVRVWNDVRTATEFRNHNNVVLTGYENGLVAYYQFEEDVTDSQSDGLNDLTAVNSPTYSLDIPFYGITDRNNLDQSNDVTGETYTLETTISELSSDKMVFTPEQDPQSSVILDINAVGTGDWTITVHDGTNRIVTSQTIENAELFTGLYEITFDEAWRPTIGANYHFHITSTVADGRVVSGTASDMSDLRYFSYYQFLIDDKFHPMTQMLNFLAIGNERYVATLEGGDIYEPNKIILPSGYRVRCFAKWSEYLAIGTWRGTNITDYDDGYIFFWDGIADTYNFFIHVPEGGVNTMFGTKGVLRLVAGYSGNLLEYTGGRFAKKIHKIPNVKDDEYTEFAPNSMNMWRALLVIGGSYNTDSETEQKGIYTYGTLNQYYPEVLGFDYQTSLGEQFGSEVKIGMVFPSGQDLYIGWQKNFSYGIDKVSVDNDAYKDGTIEMLLTDYNSIAKDDKIPLTFRVDFEPLENGQTITLKYKHNRDNNWTILETEDTVEARYCRATIQDRINEIQVAVDVEIANSDDTSNLLILQDGTNFLLQDETDFLLTSDQITTNSPVITGVTLETEINRRGRNA